MIIRKLIYILTLSLVCLGYTANAQSNDDPFGQGEQTGIQLKDPDNITRTIEYDPITGQYVFVSKIGDFTYREPYIMTQEQYSNFVQKQAIKDYWKDRRESAMGTSNANSLIPPIYVGGKVFDKIFGSNTIDIKLQGSADVTFGVKYQRRRDPSLTVAQQRTTNFDFTENIQLSASAKIGEKIQFKMSYNTKTQFSFENKFTLKYEGDEDDILQLIEAGNVSMPLQSTLITGTQSLFGFKTKLKFGKTTVTAIASYQDSETQNIAVSGGALTQSFELEAIDYEENRHFFLSQYFRDNYEAALATLPTVTSDINITKIEVWVTNTSSNFEDCRNIVAFTDIGEGKDEWIYNHDKVHPLIYQGQAYPDNSANDLVQNMDTTQIRNLNTVTSYLTGLGYTSGRDFEKIQKARKLSANEYSVNRKLGFITLNITLNSNQTLAVAYQYTVIGQDGVFQVGEFSDQGIQEPNLLTAKMLKSTTVNTKMPMWNLMMKNVYNIRAYQVAALNFTMDILYLGNDNGVATGYFADAPDDIREYSLLNLMGMDRLNSQNNPIEGGDGIFDFINGAATNGGTINASNGRIYFTVLEPFGSQIRNKIFPNDPVLADKYAYDSLYTLTKVMAQQYTDKNKYRLEGRYTSSSGSEINLNALNVQPGSVRVTAGGVPLVENVDYTVDYTLGRVTILNEALLNSGTTINVSLENNTALSTIRKTYLGARVEHEINPTFIIGGTILHLSERAYTTKVNYNDEPISNTIYGFDVNYQTESQWLTDVLDKLPLYETKTMSRVTVSGEFARFIQGINKSAGQTGTSYIDDFEGAKSTIDMHQWNFWHLASTPQNQSNLFPEGSSSGLANGKNRAKLAWYTIDQSVFYDRYGNLLPPNITNEELSDNRVRQILLTEIYPNKDIQAGTSTNMSVLNLAYYPKERGPYNYDTDNLNEDGTFDNPEDRWGGIMRAIESSDFNSTNVEYIEFWMMDPFYEGMDQTNIGQLYFNLGDVSEDILRDGRKAYEHGLPTTAVVENVDTTVWGRVPSLQALVNAFNSDPSSRQYQDIGYDGLNDSDERSFFADFINTMRTKVNATAFDQISTDPSSDNYHYFRGSDFDSDPVYSSILERYKKYNGNEGNSPSETEYTEDYTTNNSTLPDQEDINGDNTLSESENYYQYVIDLDPAKMRTSGQNFISDIHEAVVQVADGTTRRVNWYQFRIPVREPSRVVGNIEGFSSIRFMRMFLKGFKDDIVLRFATLDLVRGEWRTYTNAIQAPGEYQPGDQTNHTVFEMSAVNVEENSGRYPVPYCIPPGIEQEVYTGATSTVRQNEQALQLTVKNLVDGDARGVYKTTEFDFRFYKKLKMFVHAESFSESDPVYDDEVTAFIRFGSDLTDNYYEYEVPLKMTPWGTSITDEYAIWPESNNFEIEFDKVVNVKSNRNTAIANGNTEIKVNRLYTEPDGKNTIKVLGNPTISEVRSMMIGVRNPKKDSEVPQDKSVILWVNELRMTDLSSDGGYAATGRVEAYLADLGRVTVAGSYKSAGYGSLETKITQNDQRAQRYYSVGADLDLGKFMAPEKSGMTVPVHFDHNNTTITPEYNPLDPDVKLKRSLQDLDQHGKDSLNDLSRDVTTQTNFNVTNMRKNRVGSKKPHFWDVENLNASYAYTNQEQSSPDLEYNRQKSHRGGIGYTYSTGAKPWTPFAKKKWASSQYMQLFKDFNLYYLPKSFSFNTEMYRQIHTQKMRNKSSGLILLKETTAKTWDWTRNYDFRYDITKNLNFTYNAATQAYIYEPAGNPERDSDEWKANRDTVRDELLSFGSISRFNQTVKLNYTIPINKVPFCDWLGSTINYTGNYRWIANSRYTQVRQGNTIENDNNVQFTATADLTKLYNRSTYLKNLMSPRRTNNNNRNNNRSREKVNDSIQKKEKKESTNIGKAIADNTLRIIFCVKKISFTYSKNAGVSLPGFMTEPSMLGMDHTWAPGLGFVIGQNNDVLNTAINKGWLTTDSTFNRPYTKRMSETYNYKVTMEPFTDFSIEVTGNRTYAENFSEYFRADEMGIFQFYTPTTGGNYSISYLMTATSFADGDKLFNNLREYRLEIANRLAHENSTWVNMGQPYIGDESTGERYPYGYTSNSQEVLTYAFLAAYSGQSPNSVSFGLFQKVALPNWNIKFTGLTKIPALKKYFKTITLTHGYKSTFSISAWSNDINYDANNDMAVYTGTNTRIPQYDMSQILISEQYTPLLGINLAFTNSLTPSIEYKKSRTVTLGFSNNQITEVNGREIVIGCGYTFKDLGFSISLFDGSGSKKVSNDLKIKLDLGFRRDKTTLRSIDEGNSQISSGQDKINIYLTGDYTLSQRLGMQVFFKYDMTNPFIANAYKTTNVFAGITARFSLSQ
ncbi:MAG: cell surface protein SprA [Bacteroidales bacterium]|nr:cell surface protein SprA [Bacteroidales bacterium]